MSEMTIRIRQSNMNWSSIPSIAQMSKYLASDYVKIVTIFVLYSTSFGHHHSQPIDEERRAKQQNNTNENRLFSQHNIAIIKFWFVICARMCCISCHIWNVQVSNKGRTFRSVRHSSVIEWSALTFNAVFMSILPVMVQFLHTQYECAKATDCNISMSISMEMMCAHSHWIIIRNNKTICIYLNHKQLHTLLSSPHLSLSRCHDAHTECVNCKILTARLCQMHSKLHRWLRTFPHNPN